MCSLAISILDSPAVDRSSNPGSGTALWFDADWPHSKRDALSSNRKVAGSKLTDSTQACLS